MLGFRQGPRKSQEMERATTGLGRPVRLRPKSARGLPVDEHRSHYEDYCLFRWTKCGESIGTQETMRRSRVHWYVIEFEIELWGDR